jgi:energy-coupling factor transporter ATP-binding protein EcfA2
MNPEQSACTGIAAHIYSASAGGPRGAGGLNPSELTSAANAIWLCAEHAGLVDKNRGADYPPQVLLSYKALHEARIARELGGVHASFGWIENLQVHSSPLFAGRTKIELGKLTLLIGKNGVGKTALCEWLAAVADARYLQRWEWSVKDRNRVEIEVGYLDPEPHSARVSFLSADWPRYSLDGRFTAVPTAPLKVVFPGELRFRANEEMPNDLELLSAVLRLHRYEIMALCEEIPASGTGNVKRVWFQKNENGYFLHADVKGGYPGMSFRGMSGSGCMLILMEFAILAANRLAARNPTVLVLDAAATLDTGWLKAYGEILSSPTMGFQTVACIPTRNLNLDELRWAGWKVIRLEGKPPDVTISFEVRPAP